MAIEILERREPGDRVYENTCSRCKSRLRYRRSDARLVFDQRDGDSAVINCPVCSNEVFTAA